MKNYVICYSDCGIGFLKPKSKLNQTPATKETLISIILLIFPVEAILSISNLSTLCVTREGRILISYRFAINSNQISEDVRVKKQVQIIKQKLSKFCHSEI